MRWGRGGLGAEDEGEEDEAPVHGEVQVGDAQAHGQGGGGQGHADEQLDIGQPRGFEIAPQQRREHAAKEQGTQHTRVAHQTGHEA